MSEYELYINGNSLPQISSLTGIPTSTLRYRLKKAGINLRNRTEGIRKRFGDKNYINPNKGKNRIFTEEWKSNIGKAKARLGTGKGFCLKPNGYYEFTTGKNKGRLIHCVIIEELIGRRLKKHEVVHHKNEIKTDNRIENLELMSRSEHAKLHAIENYSKRIKNNKGQFQ